MELRADRLFERALERIERSQATLRRCEIVLRDAEPSLRRRPASDDTREAH